MINTQPTICKHFYLFSQYLTAYRIHAPRINCFQQMIYHQLPLFPLFQVAKLPAGAAFGIHQNKPAAVFYTHCICGQKPSPTDITFLQTVAHAQALKRIGAEHPYKRNEVHPFYQHSSALSKPPGECILHSKISQRHPVAAIILLWSGWEESTDHRRTPLRRPLAVRLYQFFGKTEHGRLTFFQAKAWALTSRRQKDRSASL